MARLCAALLLSLSAIVAHGRTGEPVTVAGAEFAAAASLAERRLPLAGTGIARYGYFIKVYAAALYAPEGLEPPALLSGDHPLRLEIHYLRELEAKVLAEAAEKVLKRQLPPARYQELQARIDRFHGFYQDVAEGDRYAMQYAPGAGTTLLRNGRPVGSVEGADFAAAYFGIWLGGNPLSEDLRTALLGTGD